MSSLEVYVIESDGEVAHLGDAKNAHGGAMHIWNQIGRRRISSSFSPISEESTQRLWRMFGTPQLDPLENILMGITFDRVWVKQSRLHDLKVAIRHWWCDNAFVEPGSMVAPTLLELVGILSCVPRAAQGVCFNGTSVSENLWRVRVGEDGEDRPFVLGKDKTLLDGGEPWELFEGLEEKGCTISLSIMHGLVATWREVQPA